MHFAVRDLLLSPVCLVPGLPRFLIQEIPGEPMSSAEKISVTIPTSREVRSRIPSQQRIKALGLGMASFASAFGVWLISLVLLILVPWWAKLPFGLINGVAIGIMFIVGHDACHGVLFPYRWMNRLGGKISLFPSLHPYTAWTHNHNGLHHGFTNIKEKDPGFPPLNLAEYQALSPLGRWLYRVNRTWYGLGLLYFTEMWLRWEILPNASRCPKKWWAYQSDRLQVIVFALVWIGGLVAGALWMEENPIWNLFFGFFLPQFIWNWLIGFIILQQHTHPRVAWYSESDLPDPSYYHSQVQATPHLFFPGPFRFLMRNVMEHTAHHADTTIPLYRLPEAQRELAKVYKKDMIRVIWTRKGFLSMLKTCRLYDYAAHCWTDYDGTPTTGCLLLPIHGAPKPKMAKA
jgi:omega-6 fatty acid desaturase (delta-12 desaturase)